jgi:tetratricopeptide (TPR) repeat protein
VSAAPRRTRAGGAKKRPVRYEASEPSEPLRSALNAHKHGRFIDARERYLSAVDQCARSLDGWLNLAAVEVQLGHARDASAAYARARGLASDNARALRDIGIGLCSIGSLHNGIDALEAAVSLDPSLIGAWLSLSRACAEHAAPDRAIAAAREAAVRAPDDASAWIELHRALFSLAAIDRCIEPAREALALDPTYAQAAIAYAPLAALRDEPSTAALSALSPAWRSALALAIQRVRDGATAFANKRAAILHAVRESALDGPVLEFGVRFGASTRVLAEVCTKVHGFDSFAGLPEAFCAMPAGAFSMDRTPPELPSNVELHVGWFEQTLPAFVASLDRSPRLVHIDSDLYSSAKCALDALGPRINAGCVLLFDELIGNEQWAEHEHRALTESCARWGWNLEWLSISWLTGQAAVRVR